MPLTATDYQRIGKSAKTHPTNILRIDVLLDKYAVRVGDLSKHQLDMSKLKSWASMFSQSAPKKSANYARATYKQEYVKHKDSAIATITPVDKITTQYKTSSKFHLNKLPAIANIIAVKKSFIQNTIKKGDLAKCDYMMCKKSWCKISQNWEICLVLAKIYPLTKTNATCKNKVDWDNNDHIHITCQFIHPISKIKKSDLEHINQHIELFLASSTRGGSASENSTKAYIIEKIATITRDQNQKQMRFLGDLFISQTTIDRNTYYGDILGDISKFSICTGYNGIEYLIVIDGDKNTIYYTTKSYITNEPISTTFGFCVLSAVKHKNKYIIKKVIIDANNYKIYENVKSMNDANKKFGDLLNCEYVKYDSLSDKNYKTCLEKYRKTIGSAADFIIFSQIATPHFKNSEYRWSNKDIPIIFYCRTCPLDFKSNFPTQKGKELYILCLTNNKNDGKYIYFNKNPMFIEMFGDQNKIDGFFTPIYFSPSTLPNAHLFYSSIPDLNNTYIKLTYDFKKYEWNFIEKANRSDTNAYGDNFKDVELNAWNNYRNPVHFTDLVINKQEIADQMYFVNQKQPIHEAPIKMNNFVKRLLIGHDMTDGGQSDGNVIDLGGGRGSDLWNYAGAGVNKLLIAEIDKDAIDSLIIRKYQVDPCNNHKIQLRAMHADLNAPYKNHIATIKTHFAEFADGADQIFCFLALHYLTDTVSHIKNIAALVRNLLRKGGKFIYTALDETTVMNLLHKHKGKWTVHEKGIKKYEIIQEKSKGGRNAIKLIMPFNRPDYYYYETLINDDMLDKEFRKCGLVPEKEGNFSEFTNKFREKKKFLYDRLTDDDKIYSGLYKYKTYRHA
jgi:hypothetical protein